jgi:alkanesulfonate monooxygenase SsuD/methylene tetrahydromethanopterin reductase-like flavin-dependent oxidoreductase (luciferase family)
MALRTRRLRIGPMVTPLARRRPWKLARETVSLDHLSEGRLVLGVGLGSGRPSEWNAFGEADQPRVRGAMLDEALQVLEGLWSGRPFSFEGRYYRVEEAAFLPTPLQSPRIPIWVAANWPHRAPLRRAARWDGCFPLFLPEGAPEDVALLAEAVRLLRAERSGDAPFDVVKNAGPGTPEDRSARSDLVQRYTEAGATWWVDTLVPEAFDGDWGAGWPADQMRARIQAGPPRAR